MAISPQLSQLSIYTSLSKLNHPLAAMVMLLMSARAFSPCCPLAAELGSSDDRTGGGREECVSCAVNGRETPKSPVCAPDVCRMCTQGSVRTIADASRLILGFYAHKNVYPTSYLQL